MAENIYTLRLLDIVPANLQSDEQVRVAAQAIDNEFKDTTAEIRQCLLLPRLSDLPENALDLLAWQWHVDFYDMALSLERKRNLIRKSIAWHRIKGTPAAVEEVVRAAYGNCDLKEWYDYGGKPYFFKVEITLEEESTDKKRWKNVIAAINSVKNTRSWLEKILFYYPTIILPVQIHHSTKALQLVSSKHNPWNLGEVRTIRFDGEFDYDHTTRWDGVYGEAYRERQRHTAGIWYVLETWQRNLVPVNVWDGDFAADGSHTWSGMAMTRLPIHKSADYGIIETRHRHTLKGQHITVATNSPDVYLPNPIKHAGKNQQRTISPQRIELQQSTVVAQEEQSTQRQAKNHTARTATGEAARQKINIENRATNMNQVVTRQITDYRTANLADGSFCMDGTHAFEGARQQNYAQATHCCVVTKITKAGYGRSELI